MGDSTRRPLVRRRSVLLGIAGFASAALAACSETANASGTDADATGEATLPASGPATGPATPPPSIAARSREQAAAALAPAVPDKQQILAEFAERRPKEWGLHVTGVVNNSQSRQVALTFDACGGPGGAACDQKLLETLRRLNIPATLFLNSRWIRANQGLSAELAADPLFELANHGTAHLPLSVNGKSAYGIAGTATASAAYDELMGNQDVVHELTGTRPRFFRPGTAYYDDVAAAMTHRVGLVPVNFSVNGDGGATYPAATVAAEVGRVAAGDIVISHFNRPAGGTAEGYALVLPRLLDRGIGFGRLSDVLTP
ncbi:polysaccharide deacetylase family protein [Paenarthrobacter sp. CAP02]|uniref:polysaccharide deacetylase family protein n=1 Tax=Paenarthrobacter sp. CAP02 TaxID=3158144 RepID=UPI0032D9DFEA